MRRLMLVVLSLPGLTVPGFASELQRALESHWRGAWVVTSVEIRSDCVASYTNNRVNGVLVSSSGRQRFRAGELAQIDKIDLKRSRLDLQLSVIEPLLVSYQDGPFTLYRETSCRVELEVELPRALVSGNNVPGIDAALKPVLRRHVSLEEAKSSPAWNHRRRDPYPRDYEQTLARYRAWKATQVNAAVQARIDKALAEASRLTDSITSDADYVAGFASGIEHMKSVNLGECGDLITKELGSYWARPGAGTAARSEPQKRRDRGFEDGVRLVYGLELLRRLPECFVPVPMAPPPTAGGG